MRPGVGAAARRPGGLPAPRLGVALWLGVAVASPLACSRAAPSDLDALVLHDGAYLDPETMLPFSGPVVRRFPGPDARPQVVATIRDGLWEGELTLYHESGRIRGQGPMSGGARCGSWIENEEPEEPDDVYEAIKEDLESLVFYPECPS